MGVVEIAVLGLVTSVGTQLLKKLAKRFDGKVALLVVFVLTLIVAYIYLLITTFAPQAYLDLIVGGFGLAIAWYEVVLKRLKIW